MILLLDNYDSFSYNLYQLIGSINHDIKVYRNNKITLKEIEALNPSHIIISPGPGKPSKAGICESVIQTFAGKLPILGVCLGHQAICEVFGAKITYAKHLMHGKQSNIHVANGNALFKGMPPIIQAARYHSLIAAKETIPDELLLIAEDENDEVMGVKHRLHDIYGLQFHPESVMTEYGKNMIENFLNI